MISIARNRAFTLIELVVAMGLSILLSSVIIALYTQIGKNFRFDERYALMQENGRYALQTIGADLSMADFWGRVIATDTVSSTITPSANTCESSVSLFEAEVGLLINNYHPATPTLQFTPCTTVADVHKAGTSMVVIKRVAGRTTDLADLATGTVYLRTNGITAQLLDTLDPTTPPGTGKTDWQYQPSWYFIRDFYDFAADETPSLCRMRLSGSTFADPQCLAEGIQDLHVEFGIDTDADGYANQYLSTPTQAETADAVTARIFVLARSVDPVPNYVNDKTYSIGDLSYGPFNDAFLRRIYSSTVVLRNIVGRALIN